MEKLLSVISIYFLDYSNSHNITVEILLSVINKYFLDYFNAVIILTMEILLSVINIYFLDYFNTVIILQWKNYYLSSANIFWPTLI